jgi:RHS repeat-associated protein
MSFVRNVRGAVGIVAALFCVGTLAQESLPDFYKEPGIYPNRDYVNQHVTENVDPFTGSLQIHSTDVFLPGSGGFSLKVTRSFNSNRINPLSPTDFSTSTLAGLGWTVHFGRVIKPRNSQVCVNSDNGTAIGDNPVIELPDGSRQVLAFTGQTSPLMMTTQRWRADCYGTGNGLTVRSPDGMRYDMVQFVTEVGGPNPVYAWYTSRIYDRNGNYANISYAAAGSPEITSIIANDGRSISFTYLDSGLASRRINTITQGQRVWTYSYLPVAGVVGRYFLTQVTRPDAAATSWRYSYNEVVGSDNAANYQMNRMFYPQGGYVNYGYSHVFFSAAATLASRSAVVSSKTTSDGGNWTFAYSPGYATTFDTTTVNTPTGTITYRHYGANLAGVGNVWRIGLLAEKVTGAEQTEALEWGSQVISNERNVRTGAFTVSDPGVYAPHVVKRTVVRNGATCTTTFSNHDTYGNPGAVVEAGPNGGNRTTNLTYYYDTALWIVKQVDDETTVGVGTVTRTWNANGNLSSETRDGVITQYAYDAAGNIIQITRPRGLVWTYGDFYRGIPRYETHPEGATVEITRIVSSAGNIESERNGELFTTTYAYDGLNRLTRIGPPRGFPTTISYTATTRTATRGKLVQTTTDDAFGRVASVTTDGKAIAYSHDTLGRKTFQSLNGNTSIGRTFTYDILDRLKVITHADNNSRGFTYVGANVAVRDERNYTTTYTYRTYGDPDTMYLMATDSPVAATSMTVARNGRDKVTSVFQNGITRSFGYDGRYYLTSAVHPEVGTTTYGRDDAGNMTSKTVGSSGAITYAYDQRNRLKTVTFPGIFNRRVVNTYDRNNKLTLVETRIGATDVLSTRRYSYDANQNLITEGITYGYGDGPGTPFSATYAYSDNDQLGSITYPALGRVVNLNGDYLGRPTTVSIGTPGPTLASISYWPNGQIGDVAYTGGSRVTYGQNVREWPNSITVRTADNIVRVSSTIGYDAVGNIATIADSSDAAYNRSFGYDEINRLTTANGPWGGGSMTYDGRGNITSQTFGTDQRTYTYNAQNNLATFDRTGFSTVIYGYDVFGNAVPSGSGYIYDQAGNLQSTAAGQQNTYDGTNTRIKTVVGGVTTYEFRSAFGQLIAEVRRQSGVQDILKEHVYIAGKRIIEQQTAYYAGGAQQLPTLMFLQPDAAGSVVSSTSPGGGLLYKENYRPYGEQLNGAGNGFNKQWFTGQTQDSSDLIYMGARYYNPFTGRFLAMDPKEVDPKDLHSFNRYAYANNNPNRFVDPDGNSPLDIGFLVYDLAKLGIAIYSGAGVGAAALDVALSAVGVLSPVPGTGLALKAARAEKTLEVVRGVDHAVDAAKGASTLKPGPFAKESIPGHMGKPTAAEQQKVNALMEKNGCHTCGTTNPGTKKGNAVVDHQPPQALDKTEQFLPHCIDCMRRQGGETLQELIKRGNN